MLGETRAIIGFISITVFFMGSQFLFTALTSGVPMPPETHGDLVYEIPADLWALCYMGFSGLIIAGVYFNRGGLIATGAFIGMFLNVLFSMAADAAEFGYLLEKGSFRDALGWAGLFIWSLISMKGKRE